jgi:hypothetical protein
MGTIPEGCRLEPGGPRSQHARVRPDQISATAVSDISSFDDAALKSLPSSVAGAVAKGRPMEKVATPIEGTRDSVFTGGPNPSRCAISASKATRCATANRRFNRALARIVLEPSCALPAADG